MCELTESVLKWLEGARGSDPEISNECMVRLGMLLEKASIPSLGGQGVLLPEQHLCLVKELGALVGHPCIRVSALHSLGYGNSTSSLNELLSWLPAVEKCFDLESLRQWLFSISKMLFPRSVYSYPEDFFERLTHFANKVDDFSCNGPVSDAVVEGIKEDIVNAVRGIKERLADPGC